MSENAYVILAFLLSSAIFAGLIGTVWIGRRMFMRSYGQLGLAAIVIYIGSLLAPAVIWCAALLFSLDRLHSPIVKGVGGAPYGLQYENYVGAIAWLGAAAAGGIALATGLAKVGSPLAKGDVPQVSNLIAVSQRGQTRMLDFSMLLAGLAMFTLFYSLYGWERLWYSPMGRFELAISIEGLKRFSDVKFFLPALLAIGTVAAVSLVFSRKPLLPLLTVGLVSMPLITQASRGFTVLFLLTVLALMKRWKFPLWLGGTVSVAATLYAFYVPISMRDVPETGLKVFVEQHTPAALESNDSRQGLKDWLIAIGQNVSISFPILVEVMSDSNDATAGIPRRYWQLSFLPTISAVDGFAERLLSYTPFVNYYTPYSAFAELHCISRSLVIAIPPLWLAAVLCLTRALSRRGVIGALAAVAVVIVFLAAMIQAQQYPIRTTMRFIYLSLGTGIIGLVLSRMLKPAATERRHLAVAKA